MNIGLIVSTVPTLTRSDLTEEIIRRLIVQTVDRYCKAN